jgi:hypothetical protein
MTFSTDAIGRSTDLLFPRSGNNRGGDKKSLIPDTFWVAGVDLQEY